MTDFFTSDLHLGHEAIIKFAGRPFFDSDEMEQTLIDNINARVGKNDRLFILGDVTMARGEKGERIMRKFLDKLVCKNVYLILGNHDIQDVERLRKIGFKEPCIRRTIKENGHKVVLDHFPIAEWDGFFRGAYHLHGHIHSNRSYNLEQAELLGIRRYDVGVDANDLRPVSWEEIEEFFDAFLREEAR